MNEKVEALGKLGALYEMLHKCKEIVQGEGLVGGHRGNVDEIITDAKNEVYEAIEQLKGEIKDAIS